MVAVPDELYRGIGIRIRQERERRGWTQGELADRVGLGRTSMTNIEGGRQRLLVHQLWRIARALSIQARDLLPDLPAAQAESVEELLASVPKEERDFVAQVVQKGKRHGKTKPSNH
jgi:transcriptional regulator with XRE-family HTH domain